MKTLVLLLCCLSFNVMATDFWDSDFPDHVDRFIYEQVHYKCHMADYVDGIIAFEEVEYELGKTYVADFSMYGDIAQGYIAVDETFEGDLELSDLECPRP